MVASTRVARLLDGTRGRPPGDLDTLAETIVVFSELAWAGRTGIVAMEINPLMVLPKGDGVVATDAFVQLRVKKEHVRRQASND